MLAELKEIIKYHSNTKIYDNYIHTNAAVKWLLRSREKNSGFRKSYNLLFGWEKPYPETTGYILKTLIKYNKSKIKNKLNITNHIKSATSWLLKIQNSDGSFNDTLGEKKIFDTGQILIGLIESYKYFKERKILDAILDASNWLCNNLNDDGSWNKKYSYNNVYHTYYSRVDWALLLVSELTKIKKYKKCAVKNLKWVVSNQKKNGYFKFMGFNKNSDPYLHTIAYTIEGILNSYKITKINKLFYSAQKAIDALIKINMNRDFILFSQYNENWIPTNRSKCTTGLLQMGIIYFDMYKMTKKDIYLKEAQKILAYLKPKQILNKKYKNIYGSFPSSIPVWGKYGRFSVVNWNNKFFLDFLLKFYKKKNDSLETFKYQLFNFYSNREYSEKKINIRDKYIIDILIRQNYLKSKILDVGCGKGKYVNYLNKLGYDCYGIDPSYNYVKESKNNKIKLGNIYKIPYKKETFNTVLLIEVMQHIGNWNKALHEILRVLKNNGNIIILDRDRNSLIGKIKPILELFGFWMYKWDYPFKELWLDKNSWNQFLNNFGNIKMMKTIYGNEKLSIFLNKYILIVVKVRK